MLEPRLQRFLDYFNQLASSNLNEPLDIYHVEVEFIDPVHRISGREALQLYLQHGYQRLNFAQFTALQGVVQQDSGFLSWIMTFSHPAIAQGQRIEVHGCSELRWQGAQIIYHRDYYDLTEMVYQHVPLVGWLTTKIKQKMSDN